MWSKLVAWVIIEVPSHCAGVYQIGEVYARSWLIMGTSSGMFSIPNYSAS